MQQMFMLILACHSALPSWLPGATGVLAWSFLANLGWVLPLLDWLVNSLDFTDVVHGDAAVSLPGADTLGVRLVYAGWFTLVWVVPLSAPGARRRGRSFALLTLVFLVGTGISDVPSSPLPFRACWVLCGVPLSRMARGGVAVFSLITLMIFGKLHAEPVYRAR